MNFFFLTGLLVVGLAGSRAEVTVEPWVGPFVHAEGPHWEQRTQKLLFVDIVEQKICKADFATDSVTCAYVPNGQVGFVVPMIDYPNAYLAGAGHDLTHITWNSDNNVTQALTKTLASVETNITGNRWNDGKADSMGRLWAGTIGEEKDGVVKPDQAALYRVDGDINVKVEVSPVTNSNGLVWNGEDNKFYYIDTPTRQVHQYDFDSEAGTISNKKVAFDLNKTNITGLPDGMTIDTDGNLWIALYNGGGVVNVDPRTAEVLRFIELPVKQVTSIAFGGPLLNTLHVTTSRRGLSPQEQEAQPYAGYVFQVKGLGVTGLLSNSFYYNVLP